MSGRGVVAARLLSADEQEIRVRVDSPEGEGVLWYRAPEPTWASPPADLDFAGVALVQYAATLGCDLHLEGRATTAQLQHLDEYQLIWSVWRPDRFHRITVRADDEVDVVPRGGRRGAVLPFSGGVDAGFALAAHASGVLGRLNQDVTRAVLILGWDLREENPDAVRTAADSARRALEPYGVPLTLVSTNWRQDYCRAWFMSFNSGVMSTMHTFSTDHVAAIHATDHNYRLELDLPPYGSHTAINHLLGHFGFPVVSTGGTHRRIERVEFLRDHPSILDELRVCYQADAGGRNCGRCEKCVRTQLELRAVGVAEPRAFPSPMTVDDLRGATVGNPTVLMHFEDIRDRLAPDDELRPVVEEWVREQRARKQPRLATLERRVQRLRRQLQKSQGERDEALQALSRRRRWSGRRVSR